MAASAFVRPDLAILISDLAGLAGAGSLAGRASAAASRSDFMTRS